MDVRPPQLESLDNEAWARYKQKLQISGYEVPDPFSLTDWEDNIHKWPPVEYGDIYNYLINSPGVYTQDTLKAYKSLDAYSFYSAGHVHQVFYHNVSKESPVCVLKSKVTPSQSVTDPPREAWVVVDKKGAISAAHCTCMAGYVLHFYIHHVLYLDNSSCNLSKKWQKLKQNSHTQICLIHFIFHTHVFQCIILFNNFEIT